MKNECTNLELQTTQEVPITNEQYGEILSLQEEILKMLASSQPSEAILAQLCRLAESLLPNAVASIMLLNKETGLMSVLSAPSVPEAGHKALQNLKPGPKSGSCGNVIFKNEPQFVHNTFEDVRWEDIRSIATDFNLCSCWSMPVRDKDGNAIGTFALSSFEHRSPSAFHKKLLETAAHIVSIVLENAKKERKLQLFALGLENASEGVVITNEHNHIIEVNKAFLKLYGYKPEDVIGKNPKMLASDKHSKEFYEQMWREITTRNRWTGEIINKKANGEEIVQWLSISVLTDTQNGKKNYLGMFTDLTKLKKTQEKLEFMAFHDPVTRLYNKSTLESDLLQSETPKQLLLININNFSYINSAYGYTVGDELLREVAQIFQNNFASHTTYRINADEFALLYDADADIVSIIKEIQNYFYAATLLIRRITLNISMTYGAASGEKNLLRNAALALKQAKENGKGNYYIYDENDVSVTHKQREMFIESNLILHNALIGDGVIPYFQGIRDNATGKIEKYEVLARIVHKGDILSPFMFLDAARLSGLLPEITKIIIEKSFAVMSKYDCSFSINITEDDLSKNYLQQYLLKKADKYNINPKRVILEILEGVSASGKKNHLRQLKALKELGFSLAIDDFGSEYSNFERILDLDIDFIKIDARYIKDIHTNKKSYEVTRAIVFFAKNAAIETVAEFVHSKEVQEVIEELGVNFSQGYLFSEPAPL